MESRSHLDFGACVGAFAVHAGGVSQVLTVIAGCHGLKALLCGRKVYENVPQSSEAAGCVGLKVSQEKRWCTFTGILHMLLTL